jgi:hypothetical protein
MLVALRSVRATTRIAGRRIALFILGIASIGAAAAQDSNFAHSIADIEARLLQPLKVVEIEQARPSLEGDRSARVVLADHGGGPPIVAKWKPVRAGAEGFNNEPRYELAAYRFQKFFLDEGEYVVPPVVLRSESSASYAALNSAAEPTLKGSSSVLFLLAYWVENVTNNNPFREELFESDLTYARHWGNTNILTHLISHRDGNLGNLLISTAPDAPRVFSVDNDVAFGSEVSGNGEPWSRLRVDRLPRRTIDRLRVLTLGELEAALGVVAEFTIIDGQLVPAALGANLAPRRGVRMVEDRVQVGLTSSEIRDIESRIRRLLRRVDRGSIETF